MFFTNFHTMQGKKIETWFASPAKENVLALNN